MSFGVVICHILWYKIDFFFRGNIFVNLKIINIFLILGLACQTSSVYLYRPQVYVALPRFSFEIPSNIETLRSFENTFENIMTLIVSFYLYFFFMYTL